MFYFVSSPFFVTDAYKLSHWDQYPKDVNLVCSNFTPRKSRNPGCQEFCFFGLQAWLSDLSALFEISFFSKGEQEVVEDYKNDYTRFFKSEPTQANVDRVRALHDLGYLPLEFRALPEGTVVPHGIPYFIVYNTHPDFCWLTNWTESWLSMIWHMSTTATTALLYRRQSKHFLDKTSDLDWMLDYQNHDFSMRGQTQLMSAACSGAGHALFSNGSDTCPVQPFIDFYYGEDGVVDTNGPSFVTSVPATEHSVACASGQENELKDYYERMLDLYPEGILSMVSDTWDFWKVVTEYLPSLKDKIMARPGKLVIRPDSSPKTPVEIICGDPEAPEGTPENRGLARCLYDTFGGTKNSKGYIALDPHIGMIYGDSITLEYHQRILVGLEAMGFATDCIVFGVGSYTYQYVTRDTHGIAIKATAVGLNTGAFGENMRAIFKDPLTDRSGKKSAYGLLKVVSDGRKFKLLEDQTWGEVKAPDNEMQLVWSDGDFVKEESFAEIRKRAQSYV